MTNPTHLVRSALSALLAFGLVVAGAGVALADAGVPSACPQPGPHIFMVTVG